MWCFFIKEMEQLQWATKSPLIHRLLVRSPSKWVLLCRKKTWIKVFFFFQHYMPSSTKNLCLPGVFIWIYWIIQLSKCNYPKHFDVQLWSVGEYFKDMLLYRRCACARKIQSHHCRLHLLRLWWRAILFYYDSNDNAIAGV